MAGNSNLALILGHFLYTRRSGEKSESAISMTVIFRWRVNTRIVRREPPFKLEGRGRGGGIRLHSVKRVRNFPLRAPGQIQI